MKLYPIAKLSCPLLLAGLFLSLTQLSAQRVEISASFRQLLDQTSAEIMLPSDTDYRDMRVQTNRWLEYDFAIRSRREKMEILYVLVPYQAHDRSFIAPHVKAMRLAMHLATNDEQAVMSSINLPAADLQSKYGADWGKLFVFQPKEGFSQRQICQMLVLFRENQGMAFVFFLFDKAPFQLDSRHLALRFHPAQIQLQE